MGEISIEIQHPCASTCVCQCWSWARFKSVDDEFFATPDGRSFLCQPTPPGSGHRSERCHHGKHGCALRWRVHSHSDLLRGQAGHIEVPLPVAGPAKRSDGCSYVGVLVLKEVGVLHFRRTTHSCLFILFLTVRLRWMDSSSISTLAYQIAVCIQQNPIERLVFRFSDTIRFSSNRCWQQQVAAVCWVCPATFGRTYSPFSIHDYRMLFACSPSWLSRSFRSKRWVL